MRLNASANFSGISGGSAETVPEGIPSPKLSDLAIKRLKAADKPVKAADGGGLYLFVTTAGSKLWRMDYRIDGRRGTLSFGAYPYVSLADARGKRTAEKSQIAAGIDPAEAKRETRVQAAADAASTFEAVCRTWLDAHKPPVWSVPHWNRIVKRMERDAFPSIGAMPIGTIRPADVLAMVRKVEARGAITMARRLKQTCEQVFAAAIPAGLCQSNPCAGLQAAMVKPPLVEHRRRLVGRDLPTFFCRTRSVRRRRTHAPGDPPYAADICANERDAIRALV